MRGITRSLIVVVCAAAPYTAAQTNLADLRKQVTDAQVAVFEHRLAIPDCSAAPAAELATFIDKQATKSGVKIATQPVAAAEKLGPSLQLNRIDISGHGDFGAIDLFLHRIAMQRLARMLDFERMTISASSGGTVMFNARVAIACWSEEPPTPTPRPALGADVITPMYRARLDTLHAELDAISKLDARFQPHAALDLLSALDADWKERAAALTEFRLSNGVVTLRGVTLGTQARTRLDTSLRKSGLQQSHIERSKLGDCDAFVASGHLKATTSDSHSLAFDLFDERAATLCSANASMTPTAINSHGTGNLTLHLRDVDIADLFYVLDSISPSDGFIVEPNVKGRVTADLENVTVADALEAVRRSAVVFIGPGPLHRVCRADCGAPSATSDKYAGEPITLTLRDADVIDILRTFEQITGLTTSVPHELTGRISIFAQDTPWDRLFDGIVSAFRLTYTIEKSHVTIGHGAAISTADAAKAHGSAYRRRWSEIREVNRVTADDLHLAAIAGADGKWTAYAYAPGSSRTLLPLKPGGKLLDGTITAIGPTSLTMISGKTIGLPLP